VLVPPGSVWPDCAPERLEPGTPAAELDDPAEPADPADPALPAPPAPPPPPPPAWAKHCVLVRPYTRVPNAISATTFFISPFDLFRLNSPRFNLLAPSGITTGESNPTTTGFFLNSPADLRKFYQRVCRGARPIFF